MLDIWILCNLYFPELQPAFDFVHNSAHQGLYQLDFHLAQLQRQTVIRSTIKRVSIKDTLPTKQGNRMKPKETKAQQTNHLVKGKGGRICTKREPGTTSYSKTRHYSVRKGGKRDKQELLGIRNEPDKGQSEDEKSLKKVGGYQTGQK
ncbi:hypothetical protein FRC18_006923 [Serendipita sp. 400]|nr:hypothetical protein FRC18_006923 [Serendipita sp. 400]